MRAHQQPRLTVDEEGISLVEMLIAMVVLGIILSALAQVLASSLTALRGQERHIKANALANELIEEVQGVPWEDAGLCNSGATGNETSSTFTSYPDFEGQPLVVIPDDDPTCSTPDPDRLLPSRTIVRDGVSYDARLAIVWEDDPVDDTDPIVGDTDPEDYKRIVVDLTWDDQGDTREFRAEARRSPIPVEDDFVAVVNPDIIRIKNLPPTTSGDPPVGANLEPFQLRAESIEELQAVRASWVDRSGSTLTRDLVTSDGGFTWTFDVPKNVGPFRNGETTFTFTGTFADFSTTETVYRALFLHDVEWHSHSTDPHAPFPTDIDFNLTTGLVCDFTVEAHIRGSIQSDDVTLTFTDPATGTTGPTLAMVATGDDVDGAIFTSSFPLDPPEDWTVFADDSDLTATVTVFRPARPTEGAQTVVTVTDIDFDTEATCPILP